MKEKLITLSLVCIASAACAQGTYNLDTDWSWGQPNNPNGAWAFGYKNESSPGTFDAFVPFDVQQVGLNGGWDDWTSSSVNSTLRIFFTTNWGGWSFSGSTTNTILNAWTSYAPTVRLTPTAGTYNLSAMFSTGGYVAPTEDYPDTRIYVSLNGSDFLLADELFGFTGTTPGNNGSSINQQLTINPGDVLEFFIAGDPEARANLDVILTPIPEPSTLALLGLAGLGLVLRRRK